MSAASAKRIARLARGVLPMSLYLTVAGSAHGGDPPNVEANRHFQNGVAAFHEKRFAEAVDEFAWAYRVAPAFQVLYNIGQVNAVLERNAEAVRAFRAYLEQGGAAIAPNRRADVEGQLRRLRALVGAVRVAVAPAAAAATLDGAPIASRPTDEPVWVDPGRHTLRAALDGYRTETRELSIAAGGDVALDVTLQPLTAAVEPPPIVLGGPSPPGDAPTAPGPAHPARAAPLPGRAQRTAAYALGAGGAGLMLAGSLLALTGADKANTARERLAQASSGSSWDAAKVDYDSGAKQNDIGWVVAAVGAASAAAAVLVYATAPSTGRTWSVGVAAVPSPLASRVAVVGSW